LARSRLGRDLHKQPPTFKSELWRARPAAAGIGSVRVPRRLCPTDYAQ